MRIEELEEGLRQAAASQSAVQVNLFQRPRQVRGRHARVAFGVLLLVAMLASVLTWRLWEGSRPRVSVHAGPTSVARRPTGVAPPESRPAVDPAAGWCFPSLTADRLPDLPRLRSVMLPRGLAPLLVVGTDGQLWTVANDEAARLTTSQFDTAAGYLWAQWDADGTILASRLLRGHKVRLERLRVRDADGLLPVLVGGAEVVTDLPFTVTAEAPPDYCPINGFLAQFTLGPAGLLLVRHAVGSAHFCPPPLPRSLRSPVAGPRGCGSQLQEDRSFELRSGNYATAGRDLDFVSGGPFSDSTMAGSTHSRNFAFLEKNAVTVVQFADYALCCFGWQFAKAFALSPDGNRLAYSSDGRSLHIGQLFNTHNSDTMLWKSPDTIDALAWTAHTVAVAHGGRLTLVPPRTARQTL